MWRVSISLLSLYHLSLVLSVCLSVSLSLSTISHPCCLSVYLSLSTLSHPCCLSVSLLSTLFFFIYSFWIMLSVCLSLYFTHKPHIHYAHAHTHAGWKIISDRLPWLWDDGGPVQTASGCLETESGRDSMQSWICAVYLESYSWGEGKEQQSSNRATRVIIFSPVYCGAVGTFALLFPRNREREKKRREMEQAPRRAHTIIKSDAT